MIEKLVAVLRAAKLEPTAEELADAIWLAANSSSMTRTIDTKPRDKTPANNSAASSDPSSTKSRHRTSQTPLTDARLESEGPAGELHQAMGHAPSLPTKRGVAMATPAASALPGALEISRALRPLKRRVPSRVHFEVDEEATAQRIAERAADPVVVRPLRTRWLNLTLLIDEGPSMPIWQQTVRELYSLFGGHGAFGRVRRCAFMAESSARPRLYARSGSGQRTVGARELVDPAGRQLVLVVSDCVSAGWHDGRMVELLNVWARRGPVGLLQVLPPRLWQRTALGAAIPVGLRADRPAAANMQLVVEKSAWWLDDDSSSGAQIPIPVLGLERASIEAWTNLVAARTSNPVGGVILDGGTSGEGSTQAFDGEVAPLARPRVAHFRATSSLKAQKLATYFASSHYLSLPVMRLIQQTMVPDATLGHLAEVFLAGLLQEGTEDEGDPEYVRYYFVDGVRELLLNAAEEESIRKVLTAVSDYTTAHLGHKTSFRAILADSDADGDEIIPEHEASFARIGADILRRLGGEYENAANRIGARLHVPTSPGVYRFESRASDDQESIVYEKELIEYAREYESIRNYSPSSDRRTRALDNIFQKIRDRARKSSISMALDAFRWNSEGMRIVAVAILAANPDSAGFDVIYGAIAAPKSKFEQYHALRVAYEMLPRLSLSQKSALRDAIVQQRSGLPGTSISPESDRWWMSEEILQILDAAHQIVLVLDIASQSIEAVEKYLPTKYGHRAVLQLSDYGITYSSDSSKTDELTAIESVVETVRGMISASDLHPHIYLVGRASLPVLVHLGRRLPRVEVTVYDEARFDAAPYLHVNPEAPGDTSARLSATPPSNTENSFGLVAVTISIDPLIPLELVSRAFAVRPALRDPVLMGVVEIRLEEQLKSVGPTVRGTLAAMQLDEGFAKAAAHGHRLALFIDDVGALAFLVGRAVDTHGFLDIQVLDIMELEGKEDEPTLLYEPSAASRRAAELAELAAKSPAKRKNTTPLYEPSAASQRAAELAAKSPAVITKKARKARKPRAT